MTVATANASTIFIARGIDDATVDVDDSGIAVVAAAATADASRTFVAVGDDETASVACLSVDIENGICIQFHLHTSCDGEGGTVTQDEVGGTVYHQSSDVDVAIHHEPTTIGQRCPSAAIIAQQAVVAFSPGLFLGSQLLRAMVPGVVDVLIVCCHRMVALHCCPQVALRSDGDIRPCSLHGAD